MIMITTLTMAPARAKAAAKQVTEQVAALASFYPIAVI